MRWIWLIGGGIVLAILVRMTLFTVDPTEFVYVTQFGAHVATHDGASEAGLYTRWPWPIESILRLDRRLQHFDLPPTELLTQEGKTIDKTLTVEAFVCWRILGKDEDPDAVDRFIRRMGTVERARDILGQRVSSALGAFVARRRMDDLISTEVLPDQRRKVDVSMEELRDELLKGLQDEARQEYGIALKDVRLRRFNHPIQVREEIFDRIRAERKRKVEFYRSEGEKEAKRIGSDAEEKARILLADARAKEKELKGRADADADQIRNVAHSQDPEFYAFLKQIEQMQSILGENKALLLLSTHRPIFEALFNPPRAGASNAPLPGAGNGKEQPPPAKGGKR